MQFFALEQMVPADSWARMIDLFVDTLPLKELGFKHANPAIVPDGVKKGHEVLKEEKLWAFSLLHNLNSGQLKKAIIDTAAPGEIITGINSKAMIEHPVGLPFPEMTKTQ